MNPILLYIDPEENERQQMIQIAADLVETLTFQFDGHRPSPKSIAVIAEPSACLEIGLSMLGRGEARTVEGGERRASPLVLYPFITGLSRENGEANLVNREGTDEPGDFGMLDDLAIFGAIERDPDISWGQQSATEILEKILQSQPWQSVVMFASDDTLSQIQGQGVILNNNTRIINARLWELDKNEEHISALLERLEPRESEDTYNIRREAIINALRLETLLSNLERIGQ